MGRLQKSGRKLDGFKFPFYRFLLADFECRGVKVSRTSKMSMVFCIFTIQCALQYAMYRVAKLPAHNTSTGWFKKGLRRGLMGTERDTDKMLRGLLIVLQCTP